MITISKKSWHYRWTNCIFKTLPCPAVPAPGLAGRANFIPESLFEYLFFFIVMSALSVIVIPIYLLIQALKYPKMRVE